jgi:hypothetical protein
MGKRIRPRGSSIASAYQHDSAKESGEASFRAKISGICPGHLFDDETLGQLYAMFGGVIGKWFSEIGQPELLPIATRLATTARSLDLLAQRLSSFEGFQSSEDIEFALLVRQALAHNPLVGNLDRAHEKLASFQAQCSEMAQVFWLACITLKEERGQPGRPRIEWYDDFTALLFKLASLANIEPTFYKDRISGERRGWLFEAAQVLEVLFYPPMRSETPEACGKRLERSSKRLKQRNRQNRP